MSWLVKSAVCFVVGLSLLLSSCEAPKEIGLPPNVLVGVKYTDTITVRTSTVLLDSIRTSGALQLLVGRYKDPNFGAITANTFFEINPPGIPFDIDNTKTFVYDSASINMNFSYVYGDTSQIFQFNINRLTDTLLTKTYYNYNTASFAAKPLMTIFANPTLGSNGVLYVRRLLPNDFGKEIFALNGSDAGKTISGFIGKIKGLTFQSDASNKCIMGLSAGAGSIYITMYYHEKDQTTVLSKSMGISYKRFNQIQSNRTGTNLATLQPLKPTTATTLKGYNYIQDAIGVVTKVEFPYLDNMFKNKGIAINRAELTITPEKTTNPVSVMPPPTPVLTMVEADDNNRVARNKSGLESILAEDATTYNSSLSPQFVFFDSKFRNYNFIMTTYFEALATKYKKNKGLFITPMDYGNWSSYIQTLQALPTQYSPYFNSSLSQMYFKPDKENLKLVVFYTESK